MQQYAENLLKFLDVLLERTYAESPKRKQKQSYMLNRQGRKTPALPESLLESAIWTQWNKTAVEQSGEPFAAGMCRHVQSYQVPLQASRSDTSWGKVDLVGVTESGLPAILELKGEKSREPPLRILVEGLAYAVAIRRAWNEGHLRDEWTEAVMKQSNALAAPLTLLSVPVIGIAPTEYWRRCIGTPGRRTGGKVPDSAWKAFHQLCDACAVRGFPIHFLQFSTGRTVDGLPAVENIEVVSLPR